jgi:hypothetical protein
MARPQNYGGKIRPSTGTVPIAAEFVADLLKESNANNSISRFSKRSVRSELQQNGCIWKFANAPAISDEIVVIDYALDNGLTILSRLRDFTCHKLCPFFVCIGNMVANIASKGVVVFRADDGENK